MENLEEIVKLSYNSKNCLENLGWNINGSNYVKLKKLIEKFKINTEHFKTQAQLSREYTNKSKNINRFTVNSDFSRGCVKKHIIKNKLLPYECLMCKNDGNWMGKNFSLILDHINGVNNDNRLENLRFLCPNCNATLDTHCGGNVKNTDNKKILKTPEEIIKFSRRLVERPDYKTLVNEINTLGYCGTGRKYGVSDNAIRKWIKSY